MRWIHPNRSLESPGPSSLPMVLPMNDSTPTGARSAPESGEKFDRLKALLREMFQLDRSDLDVRPVADVYNHLANLFARRHLS